jgi:hypothetical protein
MAEVGRVESLRYYMIVTFIAEATGTARIIVADHKTAVSPRTPRVEGGARS